MRSVHFRGSGRSSYLFGPATRIASKTHIIIHQVLDGKDAQVNDPVLISLCTSLRPTGSRSTVDGYKHYNR